MLKKMLVCWGFSYLFLCNLYAMKEEFIDNIYQRSELSCPSMYSAKEYNILNKIYSHHGCFLSVDKLERKRIEKNKNINIKEYLVGFSLNKSMAEAYDFMAGIMHVKKGGETNVGYIFYLISNEKETKLLIVDAQEQDISDWEIFKHYLVGAEYIDLFFMANKKTEGPQVRRTRVLEFHNYLGK